MKTIDPTQRCSCAPLSTLLVISYLFTCACLPDVLINYGYWPFFMTISVNHMMCHIIVGVGSYQFSLAQEVGDPTIYIDCWHYGTKLCVFLLQLLIMCLYLLILRPGRSMGE